MTLDKEKIKVSIWEKVNTFDFEKPPVVFIKIDDTEDRVWALAREEKETFIITASLLEDADCNMLVAN